MLYRLLVLGALAGAVGLLLGTPTAGGQGDPRFTVFVTHQQVHGYEWPLGAAVDLTIDDPGVPGPVDYSDTQTTGEAPWDPAQTFVEFQLPDTFEVLPGHVVSLTDGTTSKTHTVTNHTIDAVDAAADTVSGVADPGSDVNVDVGDESGGAHRHEVTDGSGDWTADFSVPGDEGGEEDTWDIGPGSQLDASQHDADGDGTDVTWQVPNPNFTVWPIDERVDANEWPLGADVDLTIDDPDVPGAVDYSDSQTVGTAPWDPEQTYVEFNFQGLYDVEPGHVVSLTDGVTSKTHTVTDLAVTSVDAAADTVSGTAAPGAEVHADVGDETGGAWRRETADGAGGWTADFSVPGDEGGEENTWDIVPGSGGSARELDEDWDGTGVGLNVPNPTFIVWPVSDQAQGYEWPEGEEITLLIDDPGVPGPVDYSDSQTAYAFDGSTLVDFDFTGAFDLEPGHVVTLTDSATTKVHTVTDLAVTGVDPDTDTVSGTSDPGAEVQVDVGDETGNAMRSETADGSGNWTADFSVPGADPGEETTWDIVAASGGSARQPDEDGDGTQIDWNVPNPNILVSPGNDYVDANDWPEGAEVTLTIDDPSNGPGVDYSETQTVGPAPWDPSQTWFGFSIGGVFDIQPGHLVTVSDGVTTKEHTVTNLTVTDVDPDTDTVSGSADPAAPVYVDICDESDCGGSARHEVADGAGDWAADFSTAGDEDFEQDTFDIVPGTNGDAREIDEDGDATTVYWRVPDPYMHVFPVDDRVEGFDWQDGVLVTLTIDDPATGPGVDYTDSVTAGPAPWDPQQIVAMFELGGIFDIEPGHVVSLADGTTTKMHIVTSVAVTGIDADLDTVTGTADPGSDVWGGVLDPGYIGRHEVADGSGGWTADLSVPGDEPGEEQMYDIVVGSQIVGAQRDADGDHTIVVTDDFPDGDGIPSSIDPDDDNDTYDDSAEWFMGCDPKAACSATGVADGVDNDGDTQVDEVGEGSNDEDPDAWPPDADDNQVVNVGDLIILFGGGKILVDDQDPLYSERSDFDGDGDVDVGDLIAAFYGNMLTQCGSGA